MLKQLRSKKLMKRVMKITLFLVIPSFIALYGFSQLGRSGQRGGGGWYFIKIKESEMPIFGWSDIGQSEMKMAQEAVSRDYQTIFGVQNQQMADMVNNLITPQDVALQAVDNRILFNKGKEKGLRGTQQELIRDIKSIYPQDPAAALQFIMQQRGYGSEEAFIQDQIYRMTLDKSRFLYHMQAKTSLFEMWQNYLLLQEKINTAYAVFEASDYMEEVEISDSEIRDYYEQNQEDYRTPNQVKYEYIAINKNDLVDQVEPEEEAVGEYYEENRETEFKKEYGVKVRLVQRKFGSDPTSEQLSRLDTLMNDMYTSITRLGMDFAEMADSYSDDPANTRRDIGPDGRPTTGTLQHGGLLNTFWTESMIGQSAYDPTVIETALDMEEGEISQPIRGESAYYLVKVEETRPEEIIPFEEAEMKARQSLKRQIGQERFQEQKIDLFEAFRNITTLSGLAQRTGMEVKETDFIREGTAYIPGIGNLSRFSTEINALEEGGITEVLETDFLVAVLKLAEKSPSHVPEFQEVEEQVSRDVRMAKALDIAKEKAQSLYEASGSLESMREAAEEMGIEIRNPEPFNHANSPRQLSNIPDFGQMTIRTKTGTPKISELKAMGRKEEKTQGYAVWLITEKIPPSREKFLDDLPELRQELIVTKQKTILRENLADLRDQYEYEINPEFLGIGEE